MPRCSGITWDSGLPAPAGEAELRSLGSAWSRSQRREFDEPPRLKWAGSYRLVSLLSTAGEHARGDRRVSRTCATVPIPLGLGVPRPECRDRARRPELARCA